MWGTLDDLKGKLGIPATDSSRDGALTQVLEGATSKLASVCRFEESDETGRIDLFQQVQEGTLIVLEKRPVATITAVEGRYLSSSSGWSTLAYDLTDAADGKLTILGRDAWWPPTLQTRPKFMQWRNVIWPWVRVTYDVTGQKSGAAAPNELQDATCALAAYWIDRELAGAAADVQIGVLSKEMMDEPVPSWVLSKIAKHREERASWV